VSKSALGRGLGKLLKEAKAVPRETESGEKIPTLSPGMATLLKAGNGGPKPEEKAATDTEANAPPQESKDRKKLVRLSLVVADVLLVFLAARLVFKSGGHFGAVEILLCAAALGLGAWLSCLALWRE